MTWHYVSLRHVFSFQEKKMKLFLIYFFYFKDSQCHKAIIYRFFPSIIRLYFTESNTEKDLLLFAIFCRTLATSTFSRLSRVSLWGSTRGLNFWCGKVFEGGQVTFLIYFENAFLVRSIFLRKFWSRVKLWFWCVFKWFKLAFLVRILSFYWCLARTIFLRVTLTRNRHFSTRKFLSAATNLTLSWKVAFLTTGAFATDAILINLFS